MSASKRCGFHNDRVSCRKSSLCDNSDITRLISFSSHFPLIVFMFPFVPGDNVKL